MNSFGSKSTLQVGDKKYEIFRLQALEAKGLSLGRLPYSLRILLENLLRQEDGKSVTANDIEFLAKWQASAEPAREIAFMPARVLMQDFTGVPAIVDLAAMRDAMRTARRQPGENQSPATGGAGDRSLRAGGRIRYRERLFPERGARVPAQSRALRLSQVGANGVP